MYKEDSGETDAPIIDLTLSKDINEMDLLNRHNYVIDNEIVDLGLPVRKIRSWNMMVTDLDEKPKVVQTTTWCWKDKGVLFSTDGISQKEELYSDFIRIIIRSR